MEELHPIPEMIGLTDEEQQLIIDTIDEHNKSLVAKEKPKAPRRRARKKKSEPKPEPKVWKPLIRPRRKK